MKFLGAKFEIKRYGYDTTQIAIDKLKCWYTDQLFDDDDFTNDWIPNDYHNCNGIHILVKELSKLNQEFKLLFENDNDNRNKRILYAWICYWLHSQNINKPKVKLPLSSSYRS